MYIDIKSYVFDNSVLTEGRGKLWERISSGKIEGMPGKKLSRAMKGKGKMLKCNTTDDYFAYVEKHPEYKVVIYGAGDEARKNYKFLGRVDFFCDQKAETIKDIDGIQCLLPTQLPDIQSKLVILICIRNKETVWQICEALDELKLDAEIFYLFQNTSFAEFTFGSYKRQMNWRDKLRIRIVCTDRGWIFSKFAAKLEEELTGLGQDVDVADEEDPAADVNHYISYANLTKIYKRKHAVRTSMVTHIDCLAKKELIKFQTENKVVCICMSSETVNKLSAWGIDREGLCYVNPAQDGEIKPRKIVLGITNRCHYEEDYRKRDDLILKVCEQLEPVYFKWKIMGEGWDEIASQLKSFGFEVEYYNNFHRDIYKELMPSLDYWIYYGFDEGAMGYLDALAAGVKTIATPQGYHLDTKCGLTYPCRTIEDFTKILKKIQEERRKVTDTVKDWTWENYAKKHLEIWRYLTRTRPLEELYRHQSEYEDGIFSLLVNEINK